MKKAILLYKKEGETPLECLSRFRRSHPSYKDTKMTYAGRLDPMAKGLLLVLTGEEVKNKEKYLALVKEYKFEVLFGFATDTHDILGKVVRSCLTTDKEAFEEQIPENLKYFQGNIVQKYPLYSSRTVKGKALFRYAREGIDVEAPEREVMIKKFKFLGSREITRTKLLADIEKRVSAVRGDFRQEEILKTWRRNLDVKHSVFNRSFFIASFTMRCSSGTYVRAIAHALGERLGIPALAYSIRRTKIGKFAKISI